MDAESSIFQTVPFLMVADMQRSLRFYVDGLGFEMKQRWIDAGKLRWCRLEMGPAALMLQEIETEGRHAWKPSGKPGEGVSIYFICRDAPAIYLAVKARGLRPETPFVGNAMWVVGLNDPDGYRLFFESDTDAPEETVWAE